MPIVIFNHIFKVKQSVIDTNNHVNNVAYIQWMQDAAIEHSAALGFSMDYYVASSHGWVAKTHYIEYIKPAFLNDEIVVQTWVTNIKKITSNRAYAFFKKDDGSLLAKAETLWVYVNTKTGRPSAIPRELLAKYIQDESHIPSLSIS